MQEQWGSRTAFIVATIGAAERFEAYVDGLQGWYRVQAYSPQYGHFIAIFDEVTASKRHERELQNAQERLSLAQRASRSGLWDWDIPAGRHSISWRNRGTRNM